MTKRILVAYATRTGSTAEVADAIARQLCEAGLSTEACPVGDRRDWDRIAGWAHRLAPRLAAAPA